MVQVHVPQGVGVRVPPWAPSTGLAVQKSRRLLRVCGFFHFRAPACRWVVSRAPILVTQQLPPLTPHSGRSIGLNYGTCRETGFHSTSFPASHDPSATSVPSGE